MRSIAGLPALDLAIHYAGRDCILEGELTGGDSQSDAASSIRSVMARLAKEPSLEAYHLGAVRQVRAMTSFERVMIYRFA